MHTDKNFVVCPFDYAEQRTEMWKWMTHNMNVEDWVLGVNAGGFYSTIKFLKEEDALAFKLKFKVIWLE